MAKKITWHKIAESLEELNFSAAGLVQLTVAEKNICLARVQDSLYACAAKCPHAGGQMADGYIDSFGNVVCSLHRYKFNLANGRNNEGYFLKTFCVEVRPGGVYIGFEESNFFKWLK